MLRPMHLVLALLIVVLPNQLHLPHTTGIPGLNLFNALFLAALGMLLLQTAVRDSASGNGAASPGRPPLANPLLIYYAALGLSLCIGLAGGSADPYEDVAIYKTAVSYSLMYFFAYYGVQNLQGVRFLIGVILLVFAVAALEGIREGLHFGFANFENEKRASGPFGLDGSSANYAGVFYSIFCAFSLTLGVLGTRFRWRYRLLALACYALGCFAIFATFSRQSFLIIGVTTFLVALRRNPLLAVLAVLGMLAYPLWAPEAVIERVEMTQEETGSGQVELEDSAASRYELWDGAWQIFRQNPQGIGFNQFQEEVEPYLPEWIMARDAQNQYLRVLAEAGIQGLLAFLFLVFAMFRISRQLQEIGRSHEARTFGTAMSMSIVAVIMGNIYSSTFFSGEVMANFWILAGLLSRYAVLARAQANEQAVGVAAATPLEQARQVYARWSARQRPEAGR